MSRRLLGYVVKLPDGTRSPRTPKPVPLADIVAPWGDGEAAEPYAVVPVFATRKPKPAPVVAAVGRYAVLVQYDDREPTTFMDLDMSVPDARPRDVGTHAEVLAAVENETPAFRRMAVRILPDGAHEAACEAARREERERVLAEVEAYAARAAKRIAQADPHSWAGGRSGAFAEIAEAVRTMGEEKGQAK